MSNVYKWPFSSDVQQWVAARNHWLPRYGNSHYRKVCPLCLACGDERLNMNILGLQCIFKKQFSKTQVAVWDLLALYFVCPLPIRTTCTPSRIPTIKTRGFLYLLFLKVQLLHFCYLQLQLLTVLCYAKQQTIYKIIYNVLSV